MADPIGLNATCVMHYNRTTHRFDVSITLNIEYGGFGADPLMTNEWNDAISQIWSGSFGNYNVVTTVGTAASDNFLVWIWPTSGRSTTMQQQQDGSVADAWGYWYGAQKSGSQSPSRTAAHEAGHLMGLPDRYTDVDGRSIPNPGWENDIMADESKPPSEDDIADIVNNCGCSTTP